MLIKKVMEESIASVLGMVSWAQIHGQQRILTVTETIVGLLGRAGNWKMTYLEKYPFQ